MLGLEICGICFDLVYIGLPNYILLPLGINDNSSNGFRYYFGMIQPQLAWVRITFGEHDVRGQGLLRERRIDRGTSMGCDWQSSLLRLIRLMDLRKTLLMSLN